MAKQIAKRMNLDLVVPGKFNRKDFPIALELFQKTDYRSFVAPEAKATTGLVSVPSEAMKSMVSGGEPKSGTVTLHSEATRVSFLKTEICIPAHTYILTHMLPELLSVDGSDSLTMDWTGTKETVITLKATDDGGGSAKA